MFLLIDFGTATVKSLLIKDNGEYLFPSPVPLGFPASLSLTVDASLLFIVETIERNTGIKLISKEKIIPKVYMSGEIASIKLQKYLADQVYDPIMTLGDFDVTVAEVGAQSAQIGKAFFRGEVHSEEITKWLPFKTLEVEIDNYQANKKLFISTIPATPRDIEIEGVIAQEKMAACYREISVPNFKSLYLTGAVFSNSPYSGFPLYLTSNVFNSTSPLTVFLDRKQCLPVLALLKKVLPEVFETVWKNELTKFECLGTFLVVDPAISKVTLELSGRVDFEEIILKKESLTLIEIPLGESATLTIEEGKELPVVGGTVGLVIDSRIRPIRHPDSERDRRTVIRDWEKSINSHGEVETLWKD